MSENSNKKNSGSFVGEAVGGRGSSNRKKFQFNNPVRERGLVEGLPVLKYCMMTQCLTL
jgi:hypothetical protein